MGKGDKKSKRGKIIAGSYGKKRKRSSKSVSKIPVEVLDKNEKKAPIEKVRKEVGYPTDKSENAEVEKKSKAAPKPKVDKKEDTPKAKPKVEKEEKTDSKPKADKKEETPEAKPKVAKPKKTEE